MIEHNISELLHIYDQPIYLDTDFSAESLELKGRFEQKILVLVKKNDLNVETESLLFKMLAACHFTDKDYYVISLEPQSVLASINYFQPETILLFDLTLHSEAFHSLKEKNTPFRFGGRKFLLCDSLPLILVTPALKSSLWTNGLKRLFNIT